MTKSMLTSNLTKRRKSDIIMANSWSFLFDEMNMSNQDFWIDDGISITGNPYWSTDGESFSFASTPPTSSPDTLSFVDPGSSAPPVVLGSALPGAMGDDHITLKNVNLDNPTSSFS